MRWKETMCLDKKMFLRRNSANETSYRSRSSKWHVEREGVGDDKLDWLGHKQFISQKEGEMKHHAGRVNSNEICNPLEVDEGNSDSMCFEDLISDLQKICKWRVISLQM